MAALLRFLQRIGAADVFDLFVLGVVFAIAVAVTVLLGLSAPSATARTAQIASRIAGISTPPFLVLMAFLPCESSRTSKSRIDTRT